MHARVGVGVTLLLALACGGGSAAEPPEVEFGAPPPVPEAAAPAPEAPPPAPEAAPPAPAPDPAPPASSAAAGEWTGDIQSASAGKLVLGKGSGDVPPIGAKGTLSRQIKQKIFGADVEAWLDVAEVSVTAATADTLTVSVDQELSDITVNGEKVDNLKPGGPVKLAWTR